MNVKSQSKAGSLVEQVCNIGSGVLFAVLTWLYVMPHWLALWALVFGYEVVLGYEAQSAIAVCSLFTIISIVRGYIWRRVFNYLQTLGWFTV